MTQRLPVPGSDDGTWGSILNGFLGVSLDSGGNLTSAAASAAGAEMTSNKGAASGYAPLDGTSKVPITNIPTGSTSTTVAIGNDSRITGAIQGSATPGGDLAGTGSTYTTPVISGTYNFESVIRSTSLDLLTSTPNAHNLNLNSNRIINLANGTASNNAIAYGQLTDWVYGDGSDGTVTFDGTSTVLGMTPSSNFYTLTRDLYLANATINTNTFIWTNGYRIFCNGTFTGSGTAAIGAISPLGNGGSLSQTTGGGGYPSSALAGAQSGAGSSTGAGTNTANLSNSLGGAGGNGGAGSNAAGTAGTVTAPSAASGTVRALPWAVLGGVLSSTTSFTPITGGTAGASGGGAGVGGDGGAGGCGGGILVFAAQFISGSFALNANGGKGGNGSGSGNSGGGGGGGGGVVIIISKNSSIPTSNVSGGTGGSPGGTGLNSGATGSPGTIIRISC